MVLKQNQEDYLNSKLMDFTSTYIPCKHENGWYDSIYFLGFKIRVFVCLDCENIFYGKRLKEIKS